MKKVNNTSIQTPSININYSANGVELRIQGCKIDCPASDVAEATKSYYDGVNRSMEECFTRMGIDTQKIGSIFNQLLNFGDENLSKLLKVASEGVNELLEEAETGEPKEAETATEFYAKHLNSRPRVRLSFDRHVDTKLVPIDNNWYGADLEYIFEAEELLAEISSRIGEKRITTSTSEAELPLIKRGIIRINDPAVGHKLHARSIRWKLEVI